MIYKGGTRPVSWKLQPHPHPLPTPTPTSAHSFISHEGFAMYPNWLGFELHMLVPWAASACFGQVWSRLQSSPFFLSQPANDAGAWEWTGARCADARTRGIGWESLTGQQPMGISRCWADPGLPPLLLQMNSPFFSLPSLFSSVAPTLCVGG